MADTLINCKVAKFWLIIFLVSTTTTDFSFSEVKGNYENFLRFLVLDANHTYSPIGVYRTTMSVGDTDLDGIDSVEVDYTEDDHHKTDEFCQC